MHYNQYIAARLHRALWRMVGAGKMDELKKIEASLLRMPGSSEDREACLDSVRTLKAVGQPPSYVSLGGVKCKTDSGTKRAIHSLSFPQMKSPQMKNPEFSFSKEQNKNRKEQVDGE